MSGSKLGKFISHDHEIQIGGMFPPNWAEGALGRGRCRAKCCSKTAL